MPRKNIPSLPPDHQEAICLLIQCERKPLFTKLVAGLFVDRGSTNYHQIDVLSLVVNSVFRAPAVFVGIHN